VSAQFGLEVHTEWIRLAAATLDQAAADLRSIQVVGAGAPIPADALGGSADAADVARLVNRRSGQGLEAAAQLTAIALGLSERLVAAAVRFERCEAALAGGAK
jgi:hypothetical protein